MSMEPGPLFASMIVGSIGLALASYGWKQKRIPHSIAGILLMVYPYFIPGVGLTVGIGAGIVGALWLAVRLGL